ncbi:MAG: FAD-dependent oxidoreductase [Bryobacterales bacterium]|nr:FAD-dependent oxidoreductase [Bryobacterales bacterium]
MDNTVKYPVEIPDVDFWKDMVPCQAACPVHTDAGRYVQLIAIGEYREAYLTARSPNPFASNCGRVCAAPCEDRCRRGKIDQPVSIRALKRFVCDKYGSESLAPDTQDELFHGGTEQGNKTAWHLPLLTISRNNVARGEKVAVIGAGPAGLSCAHDLALMGYSVTVFEASETPGGMMYHGIPEFRLARPVIEREIAKIINLGVELRLKAPLSEKFGLQELRNLGYKSVFLSIGTQRGRSMAVEGENLDGVVKAIDMLLNLNQGYTVTLGKRVLVIGGGFVAFDAARMALRTALEGQPASDGEMAAALDAARAAVRAGVSDVRMISLEARDELPVMRTAQGKEEFEEAEREGIHFQHQRGVRRFLGKDGRLEAVELVGVQRTYDENGRFSPIYDDSITEVVEADTVILAIGQQADLSFLRPEDGVELTRASTIKVDPETLATSAPGIFAGGDVAFGPRNLIEAVANGKQAALSIDNYLRDAKNAPEIKFSIRKIPTRDYRMPEDYEQHDRQAPPTAPLERRTGFSEVETTYSEEEARIQAERCLSCHIQTIYDAEKCVLCNRCVDVCPENCLKLVPLEDLNLGEAEAAAFAHYGVSDETAPMMSAMIKDDEKCIRCGLCAIRCPTDAMTMEVFFYEESESPR